MPTTSLTLFCEFSFALLHHFLFLFSRLLNDSFYRQDVLRFRKIKIQSPSSSHKPTLKFNQTVRILTKSLKHRFPSLALSLSLSLSLSLLIKQFISNLFIYKTHNRVGLTSIEFLNRSCKECGDIQETIDGNFHFSNFQHENTWVHFRLFSGNCSVRKRKLRSLRVHTVSVHVRDVSVCVFLDVCWPSCPMSVIVSSPSDRLDSENHFGCTHSNRTRSSSSTDTHTHKHTHTQPNFTSSSQEWWSPPRVKRSPSVHQLRRQISSTFGFQQERKLYRQKGT